MRPTRTVDLLVTGVVVAVLAWVLVRVVYGSLPPLPVLAGVSLALLAAAEVVLAVVLRARIQRRPGARLLDPILAARAAALAKASSFAGAATAGLWTGFGVYLLGQRDVLVAAGDDLPGTVVGLVCAVLLLVAALVLEHTCRTPGSRDRPRDEHRR